MDTISLLSDTEKIPYCGISNSLVKDLNDKVRYNFGELERNDQPNLVYALEIIKEEGQKKWKTNIGINFNPDQNYQLCNFFYDNPADPKPYKKSESKPDACYLIYNLLPLGNRLNEIRASIFQKMDQNNIYKLGVASLLYYSEDDHTLESNEVSTILFNDNINCVDISTNSQNYQLDSIYENSNCDCVKYTPPYLLPPPEQPY